MEITYHLLPPLSSQRLIGNVCNALWAPRTELGEGHKAWAALCSLFLRPTLGSLLLPWQILAAVSKSEQTTVCFLSNLENFSVPYFTVETTAQRKRSKRSMKRKKWGFLEKPGLSCSGNLGPRRLCIHSYVHIAACCSEPQGP